MYILITIKTITRYLTFQKNKILADDMATGRVSVVSTVSYEDASQFKSSRGFVSSHYLHF